MTKDEAIEILQDDAYMLYEDDSPYNRQAYDMAIEALSAERVGKWNGGELGTCSVCGHWGVASDIWTGCKDGHYCPNCGAKLEVDDD